MRRALVLVIAVVIALLAGWGQSGSPPAPSDSAPADHPAMAERYMKTIGAQRITP